MTRLQCSLVGGDGDLEKSPMTAQPNQNSLAEPSPSPSPSSTTSVPALVLSNSGKRMDQAGKKKYLKQVTGRHNDTELHLAAQRADLAAVKKILGDIDSQIVGTVSGAEFDTEVAEVRAAVVNEVNELGETSLFTAADKGHLDVVLSVGKALSIQAHPDKELARVLHKLHPSVFRDENHKPEMALALTEFEALCGFISVKELKDMLNSVPEIAELVVVGDAEWILLGSEHHENGKAKTDIESIFTRLMLLSKDTIAEMISRLKRRLYLEKKKRHLTVKEQLVLRLQSQYPGDVGAIAAFFLNYVKLNRGEAISLGPNEPHAYISGECIECMATSDNVVRAGQMATFVDTKEMLRGPEDSPGYWVVTGAKLCVDGGHGNGSRDQQV